MALYMYRYFQTVDALPDTSGPLSASLSPAAIKDANEAVRSATRVSSFISIPLSSPPSSLPPPGRHRGDGVAEEVLTEEESYQS